MVSTEAGPALRVTIGEDDVLLREGIARILTDAGLEIGVLILSQFCEPAYVMELVGDHPEGVGYLLKERVRDVAAFVDAVTRVAPPAAARSIPRWWPSCSAATRGATPCLRHHHQGR